MWKTVRRSLIVAASLLILTFGGCQTYRKTDYAADAAFVKYLGRDLLFVAL